MYILVYVYTLRYYSMHDSFYTKLITKIYRSLTNSLSHFSLAASILFQTQVHNRNLRNIYIADKYPNLSFVFFDSHILDRLTFSKRILLPHLKKPRRELFEFLEKKLFPRNVQRFSIIYQRVQVVL